MAQSSSAAVKSEPGSADVRDNTEVRVTYFDMKTEYVKCSDIVDQAIYTSDKVSSSLGQHYAGSRTSELANPDNLTIKPEPETSADTEVAHVWITPKIDQHTVAGTRLDEYCGREMYIVGIDIPAVKPEPESPVESDGLGKDAEMNCFEVDVSFSDVKMESLKYSDDTEQGVSTTGDDNKTLNSIHKATGLHLISQQEDYNRNSNESNFSTNNQKRSSTHIARKRSACSVCSYTCYRKNDLKRHMYTHVGEKPFSCTQCSYTSTMKANLTSHMLTHAGEKPFSCTVCNNKFVTKRNLTRHAVSHTGEKQFSCADCSYTSILRETLRKHILLKHSGEKRYACSLCSYTCIFKSRLREHMSIHSGEKPFACSECSYTCRRKVTLVDHMLIHTGDKPFACSECSYKGAKKSYLMKHVLTHDGEKPFACSACSFKCSTIDYLRSHTITHTGDKDYQGSNALSSVTGESFTRHTRMLV